MRSQPTQITVSTWQLPKILIEKYTYSAGTVEPLPKHFHHEYQLGMSFNCQGEYFYRGAYYPVPIGSLSIIHSGEVHAPSERTYLPKPASFLMMHVNPSLLTEIALEIADNGRVPFFTQPILSDRSLAKLFHQLCIATATQTTKLTKESLLVDFFSNLISCDREFTPKSYSQVRPAIALVCDYLQANYEDNVSLAELADIAGMSRFYLSRLFKREKGLSLSAYQIQIKIDRAKKLLAKRMPISSVATAVGFYDQSQHRDWICFLAESIPRGHFGSHFKRLVGTTPGNYRAGQ
ncbi:AraC family transcriptional regulator [Myxosarcina sp. GI1]|uniref:AraC family transcriptional regulator n=1 Tax=Myxosarcina sp. GI1 TaxID=1541065 RepID=UPI000691955D|nr:AraC family transcriptional regulator [Myxosarcina sp. GI1]